MARFRCATPGTGTPSGQALAWTDLPAGTEELALLFENIPPQTKAPFVQWQVYEISPDVGGLSEGCKHKADPRERSTWC
jgi:phosphatidylethanolamine-binding protein (PEBP) family uncharacterized protein